MTKRLKEDNDLWKIILELKDKLPLNMMAFYLSFPVSPSSEGIIISEKPQIAKSDRALICYNSKSNKGWALIVNYSNKITWPVFENSFLSEDQYIFIVRYLPYVMLKLKSYQKKSALTIGHLAMSLDGKIATKNGHSQWIGNKKNQIHSHRMRALADAILVGGNTFLKDQPQLNVRHVSGNDPVKIVMSDSDLLVGSSLKNEDVIWVNSNNGTSSEIETITIDRDSAGFKCDDLLAELFKRNIHTVYIEGGGITLSGFINSKSLDILQLHYAPILMGSGIPCIVLPEISEVGQAITFSDYNMEKMEDEWMFTGVINYNI
jgi:riboflavin-specific deaminase-like protein